MKRRDFFRNGSVALVGTSALGGKLGSGQELIDSKNENTAKNVIFLVSDGMSIGTLNMADMLLRRKEGRKSHWLSMYDNFPIRRALMDTSSASSLVTDSSAASSAWGGGKKVINGAINMNADGSHNTPIWEKFKKAGKSAGCVTTVPATHATPAGFCVFNEKRGNQDEVALQYLEHGYDVLMGGGLEYFSKDKRKDGQDVFELYRQKGYSVVQNKTDMLAASSDKPLLGIYSEDGLPYTVDQMSEAELQNTVPTLAEMTKKALDILSKNKKGFGLQIEGGKVDWAAHGNDSAALIYDQIAFDEAIGVALEFARNDGNTLVIVTTDHGNANPGLFYGKEANDNFDHLKDFKKSNSWILNSINANTPPGELIEKVQWAQGMKLSEEQALELLSYYKNLKEDGVYNPRHLPFKPLGQFQVNYTNVGWGAMDHSADYVELVMTGPGSALLNTFIQNTDLHNLMLEATAIKA